MKKVVGAFKEDAFGTLGTAHILFNKPISVQVCVSHWATVCLVSSCPVHMPSPHWRRNSDSTGFSSVSVVSPMCTGAGDAIPYVAKKSQRFLHEFF